MWPPRSAPHQTTRARTPFLCPPWPLSLLDRPRSPWASIPSLLVCVCVPCQELRKTIVSCIMATDMSLHFDLVDETKKCVATGDYTFEDVNDQVPVWCCGAVVLPVPARCSLGTAYCLPVSPPADAMLRALSLTSSWPLALSQRCVTRRSSCASCWCTRPIYPTPSGPSR